jgi:hypothetical protein
MVPADEQTPDTWLRVCDVSGSFMEISYSEELERQLSRELAELPETRGELELPLAEHPDTLFHIHGAHVVCFYVSTPEQRARTRMMSRNQNRERREFRALNYQPDESDD